MTPFGIRKRLKDSVKKALGIAPEASPAPASPAPPPPPAAAPPSPPAGLGAVPPRATPAAAPAPPPAPATPPPAGVSSDAATDAAPKGRMWVQAGKVPADEIVSGSANSVEVFGRRYALYNVEGEFFATADACPHAGGPLGDGDLDGFEITCPFHGYTFDVRSGECTSGAPHAVATASVKVKKNRVFIEVPQ